MGPPPETFRNPQATGGVKIGIERPRNDTALLDGTNRRPGVDKHASRNSASAYYDSPTSTPTAFANLDLQTLTTSCLVRQEPRSIPQLCYGLVRHLKATRPTDLPSFAELAREMPLNATTRIVMAGKTSVVAKTPTRIATVGAP